MYCIRCKNAGKFDVMDLVYGESDLTMTASEVREAAKSNQILGVFPHKIYTIKTFLCELAKNRGVVLKDFQRAGGGNWVKLLNGDSQRFYLGETKVINGMSFALINLDYPQNVVQLYNMFS